MQQVISGAFDTLSHAMETYLKITTPEASWRGRPPWQRTAC